MKPSPVRAARITKHLTPAEQSEYSAAQRKIADLRRDLQPAQTTVRRLKDLARKRAEKREATR